jgi:hypothetical protein
LLGPHVKNIRWKISQNCNEGRLLTVLRVSLVYEMRREKGFKKEQITAEEEKSRNWIWRG